MVQFIFCIKGFHFPIKPTIAWKVLVEKSGLGYDIDQCIQTWRWKHSPFAREILSLCSVSRLPDSFFSWNHWPLSLSYCVLSLRCLYQSGWNQTICRYGTKERVRSFCWQEWLEQGDLLSVKDIFPVHHFTVSTARHMHHAIPVSIIIFCYLMFLCVRRDYAPRLW